MFALLPLLVAACGVLSVIALLALGASTPTTDNPAARPWLRRTRLRSSATVAAAVLAGVATLAVGVLVPSLGGLSGALAPSLAAIVGLLVHALVPYVRPPHTGPAVASLTPRGPLSSGSRADRVVPAALALVTVLVLIGTGLTSAADESGHYRQVMLTTATTASSHGPYPGWYYAVPMMIATAALIAALGTAFARVAAAPAPPVSELFAADRALRRTGITVISRLASACLLADLGGILAIAGIGQRALVVTAHLNGVAGQGGRAVAAWGLLGAGILALLAAVVFAGLALGSALRLPIRFTGSAQQVAA